MEEINQLDQLVLAMQILSHDLGITQKPYMEYKDFPIGVADKITQRIVKDILIHKEEQKENLFIAFYTCFEMGTELGMANRKGDYNFDGYKFNYSYKSMMDFSRISSIDIAFQIIFNNQMEKVKKLYAKIEFFDVVVGSLSNEDKREVHEILYVLFNCSMMMGYDHSRQYFNYKLNG